MSGKRYLMGLDIGSSGCKVTLLDIDKNQVTSLSEEIKTYYPDPGWAEQEPREWLDKLSSMIKKITKNKKTISESIAAVGLSGVTHSLIMMDKDNNILGRTIHITDGRSFDQSRNLEEKAGDMILEKALNPVDVMWTISMLAWVREKDRERWDRISKILFPKDYIRHMLTGSIATDTIDAQGTLLYDPIGKKWDGELADLIGLDISVLPETFEPCTLAGKISSKGALWSGLKQGTPVLTGSTDTVMEVFSAGSKDEGDCTVKLATFGRICIITSRPYYGKGLINYSYIIPGKWYPGTGTKSCGTSFRWCRDQFFSELKKDKAYEFMTHKAGKIPPGSQGLIFHPYLQGEGSPYDDPRLRGDLIGLTLHHNRDHIARSVLEGTCFSLLDSMNFIKEKNIEIKPPLRFIGGGTRSSLWTQILADILGYDAVIPKNTDPSIGAALAAGVGVGIFGDLSQAQEFNRGISREILFDDDRNLRYMEIFDLYKDTQSRLVDINHKLAEKYDA